MDVFKRYLIICHHQYLPLLLCHLVRKPESRSSGSPQFSETGEESIAINLQPNNACNVCNCRLVIPGLYFRSIRTTGLQSALPRWQRDFYLEQQTIPAEKPFEAGVPDLLPDVGQF